MTARRPVAQSAEFVKGADGLRFRLITGPAQGPRVGSVVHVHGFAEEMNKSRRMCARMARLLASEGWRVVQADLSGCGDSAGEFSDASWEAWNADVEAAVSHCEPDEPLWLWCVRGGALLAPPVLARRPRLNLLLWQPVLSGAQHLAQFLRLDAGARIAGTATAGEPVAPAKALREGRTVEVAGYELAPALALGMERSSFDVPPGHVGRVVWLEVGDEPRTSPAAQRMAASLASRGIAVELDALSGLPFWQTIEIEECEALLQRSATALRAPAGVRGVSNG